MIEQNITLLQIKIYIILIFRILVNNFRDSVVKDHWSKV